MHVLLLTWFIFLQESADMARAEPGSDAKGSAASESTKGEGPSPEEVSNEVMERSHVEVTEEIISEIAGATPEEAMSDVSPEEVMTEVTPEEVTSEVTPGGPEVGA
jgi:hypothetical protein